MKCAKQGRHAANNWPMRARDLPAFRVYLAATAAASRRTERALRLLGDALLNVQYTIRFGMRASKNNGQTAGIADRG